MFVFGASKHSNLAARNVCKIIFQRQQQLKCSANTRQVQNSAANGQLLHIGKLNYKNVKKVITKLIMRLLHMI